MEVYHTEEQDDSQEEELSEESINMDGRLSTSNLSDQDEPTHLFSMNRYNNCKQPSLYEKSLRPTLILGNDKSDTKRPGW